MKPFSLPKDFLLGSATAATQIEGGDYYNNWYFWAKECRTYECESPITADEHYILYKEDLKRMHEMKHNTYRFSIDWSRMIPNKGEWNEEAVDHYRDAISIMLSYNIKPLLTIHHFSCPQWFQEEIGWHKEESVDYFLTYVKKLIHSIGDLVAEYCTINEPNVLCLMSYLNGKFPPGDKGNVSNYLKAAKNLILAHLKAYKLIHSIREKYGFADTKVGFPLNLPYFQAGSPLTIVNKNIIEYFFINLFKAGFIEGKLLPPLGKGYPLGKGTYCDFIGVNYYTRFFIDLAPNPATLFTGIDTKSPLTPCEETDVGWEIYPKGLYYVVEEMAKAYPLPIYITENGIADAKDNRRAKYIYSHLYQVSKLIKKGYDVRRYYYWSFMDNFEWAEGYQPRYGLLQVIYKTQQRINRYSSKFYTEICQNKEVTDELIDVYVNAPGNC